MGANVDIAIDGSGDFHLCFQDGLTDSLRYMSPDIDRQEWVDDGVWLDVGGRAHSVHVVGDDCNMLLDGQQQPLIVYQDATLQALLMRRRNRVDQNDEISWGRRQALRGDSTVMQGRLVSIPAPRLFKDSYGSATSSTGTMSVRPRRGWKYSS